MILQAFCSECWIHLAGHLARPTTSSARSAPSPKRPRSASSCPTSGPTPAQTSSHSYRYSFSCIVPHYNSYRYSSCIVPHYKSLPNIKSILISRQIRFHFYNKNRFLWNCLQIQLKQNRNDDRTHRSELSKNQVYDTLI